MNIKITGLDELMATLDRLGADTEGVLKKGLYEGAGEAYAIYKAETESIPTSNDWGTQARPRAGIRQGEKDDLIASLGIASFGKSPTGIDTSIGFDGYNRNGQANQLIARASNSGTSFMKKSLFADRAKRKIKKQVSATMTRIIEAEISKRAK